MSESALLLGRHGRFDRSRDVEICVCVVCALPSYPLLSMHCGRVDGESLAQSEQRAVLQPAGEREHCED